MVYPGAGCAARQSASVYNLSSHASSSGARGDTTTIASPVVGCQAHSQRLCGSLMQGVPSVERMVSRNTMTIHIPDDLARGLEGIAAAQQKSVDQVALDNLRSLFDRASSPEGVLRAVRGLTHPSAAAVDDLEAAIAAARLPVGGQGAFDRWTPQ